VQGAFVYNLNAGAVKGLTLVLVDDVSTTGATLSACAAPLIAAGAREVRALIAARAVTRQL
jgi:predicted amidophosphoribosyltransferase